MYQRGDAVRSMVYEANARVRDPVYGCVGAISSLQQQIDSLQAQLALAQAEMVHMRMRNFAVPATPRSQATTAANSPENNSPPPSTSLFTMDMLGHANMEESLWSC